LIPYLEISPLEVSFVKVDPFIVCVGIGIVVAFYSTLDRAKELGLDATIMYRMAIWIILCSFFSAHLFSMLLDYPGRLLEKPWELFYIWAPISSVGGFLGAILVVFIFSQLHRISLLAYSDALIWGFIPGWIFGRLGCFLAHDHPGIHSTFMLAVRYPNGARHDLGLYELLFTLLILWPLSRSIGKKAKAQGLLTSIMAIIYMSVRFGFDFLRASDGIPGAEPRYGILTQAQWVCMPLLFGAIVLLIRILQQRGQNFSSP
jgi:phosphatidylglycerol:prolipoprotein diacylglycerol transferase